MSVRESVEHSFSYRSVKLLRDQPLGSGSYGSVCRALCDELPCAAKILHAIFFRVHDPGSEELMRRFRQECELMSSIRHPHIVQCLGTYREPELGLPVLLMELMEDNLTHVLEHSKASLPYHVQINLSHDITLALSYLHSRGIIHRDLSSNNILLIASQRAKVTDFGMARLVDVNSRMTPLTQCPGMGVYMSPEATRTPPIYTHKLDCFSFGVLVIQILTRLFPDPGPARNTITDPRYPTGKIEVPVPEVVRRHDHIDLVEDTHPLCSIGLACLKDEDQNRPSASELCVAVQKLKEQERYADSLREGDARLPSTPATHQGESSETNLLDTIAGQRDEIRALKEEVHKASVTEKQLQRELQEKDSKIEELQQELLAAKSRQTSRLASPLEESGRTSIVSLQWRKAPSAPCAMLRGAVCANEDGSIAYFNPVGTSTIYTFTVDNEVWSSIEPETPNELFSLAVVTGHLTAIGGLKDGEVKSELFSLVEGKSGNTWRQKYPPMPSKRISPAVTCYKQYLIVAGGKFAFMNSAKLATVEALDSASQQWFTAASLCDPLAGMSMTTCGEELYLVGGSGDAQKPVAFVLTCSTATLLASFKSTQSRFKFHLRSESSRKPALPVWQRVVNPPMDASSCVSLHGQLLAVAFHTKVLAEKSVVCLYSRKSNSWINLSKVPTARSRSLCTAIKGERLMVVGGYSHSASAHTDTVEIATPE